MVHEIFNVLNAYVLIYLFNYDMTHKKIIDIASHEVLTFDYWLLLVKLSAFYNLSRLVKSFIPFLN